MLLVFFQRLFSFKRKVITMGNLPEIWNYIIPACYFLLGTFVIIMEKFEKKDFLEIYIFYIIGGIFFIFLPLSPQNRIILTVVYLSFGFGVVSGTIFGIIYEYSVRKTENHCPSCDKRGKKIGTQKRTVEKRQKIRTRQEEGYYYISYYIRVYKCDNCNKIWKGKETKLRFF